jgi:hypothetical protein
MIKWVLAPLLDIAGRDSSYVGVSTLIDGEGGYDLQTSLCESKQSCGDF